MIERNHHDNEASSINSQTAQEISEFNLFSMLKPVLKKDGNQWCVIYGENLQEGLVGFGNSPHEAILNFNRQWYEPIELRGDAS